MIKDVTCPYCKKALTIGAFEHDSDLNLICNHCRNVVFPTTKQVEESIKHILTSGANNLTNYQRRELLPIRMSTTPMPDRAMSSCDFDHCND